MTIYKVTVPANSDSHYHPHDQFYFLHEEAAQSFALYIQPSGVYRMPRIEEIEVQE